MTSSRGSKPRSVLWPKGSVLIEVIVAIVMLGVFLGGLAGTFQRSRGAAVQLRMGAASLPTSLSSSRVAEAWTWGPMAAGVEWRPGPVLRVLPGVGCDGEVLMGIWSDGWLLGEWHATASDPLELGASTWEGRVGEELILRVRKPEGCWGPPCRTVVADSYGDVGGTNAEPGGDPAPSVSFDGAFTVMHLHGLSTSGIHTSWSEGHVTEIVEDLVMALGSTGSGVCTVRSAGRSQAWIGDEGRRLDLFW